MENIKLLSYIPPPTDHVYTVAYDPSEEMWMARSSRTGYYVRHESAVAALDVLVAIVEGQVGVRA